MNTEIVLNFIPISKSQEAHTDYVEMYIGKDEDNSQYFYDLCSQSCEALKDDLNHFLVPAIASPLTCFIYANCKYGIGR